MMVIVKRMDCCSGREKDGVKEEGRIVEVRKRRISGGARGKDSNDGKECKLEMVGKEL